MLKKDKKMSPNIDGIVQSSTIGDAK